MKEDTELLRSFAEEGDEDAFRALVDRHVNLVHSIALRQVNGDAHLAADVTQLVFTDLARKASALSEHRVLAGWLFTSTRFAAGKLVRREQRRRAREQEAHLRHELIMNSESDPDWSRVKGVLDEALGALSAADREAILLRYFESRGFSDIGGRLNLSENTARMRVDRALDKLRAQLERRGVKSTSAAVAAAITGHVVTAAPAGMGLSVANAALSVAAGSGAAVFFMGMTKLQLGITTALALAGAAVITVQAESNNTRKAEIASLRQSTEAVAQVRADNEQLRRNAAETAELRRDDAEFARLRDEAAALRRTLVAGIDKKPAAPAPATGADRLPELKKAGAAVYPEALLKARTSGQVTVRFVVDAKGSVANPRAAKSTDAAFEAAALEAVRQSVFDSGVKGGRPVNTFMQFEVKFDAASGAVTLEGPAPASADGATKWL